MLTLKQLSLLMAPVSWSDVWIAVQLQRPVRNQTQPVAFNITAATSHPFVEATDTVLVNKCLLEFSAV